MNNLIPNILTKESLSSYLKNNHTNEDAAIFFNCCASTISRHRVKYGLSHLTIRHWDVPTYFNEAQYDFLIGSLLGDGHISEYSHFRISLKRKYQNYLRNYKNIMSPFSKSNLCLYKVYDNRTGKYYYGCRFNTIVHPLLKSLRSEWYDEHTKIVPFDLKLNPRILAHWYMQDGWNDQSSLLVGFATNGFSIKEADFLRELIRNTFGIVSNLKTEKDQPKIVIRKRSCYLDFINIVRPYTHECFLYKTDTSKLRPDWNSRRKLTFQQAEIIRKTYKLGHTTQKSLAKEYKLSTQAIQKIISGKSYFAEKYVKQLT